MEPIFVDLDNMSEAQIEEMINLLKHEMRKKHAKNLPEMFGAQAEIKVTVDSCVYDKGKVWGNEPKTVVAIYNDSHTTRAVIDEDQEYGMLVDDALIRMNKFMKKDYEGAKNPGVNLTDEEREGLLHLLYRMKMHQMYFNPEHIKIFEKLIEPFARKIGW